MRIAALSVPALLLVFGGCASTSGDEASFAQPNTLMADEIASRVQQIPFQHRDELLQNLMWLAQTGETTIPTLVRGLKNDNPKVRSSCAWVLGRIHDRRTIPMLQAAQKDSNETVRLEIARTLVGLGDLQPSPALIEGLDSDKKEVRYLCHEALKTSTGRDFGYDHLSENETQRRTAVLGWRQWWSEFSGDPFFAQSYQQKYHLDQPALPVPMGEGQNPQNPQNPPNPTDSKPQNPPPGNNDGVILVAPQGPPQGQGTQGQGQGTGTTGSDTTGTGTGTTGTGTTGTGTTGTGTTGTGTTGTGTTGGGTTGTGTTGTGTTGTGTTGTGTTGTGGSGGATTTGTGTTGGSVRVTGTSRRGNK